jgi:hypothetical protein
MKNIYQLEHHKRPTSKNSYQDTTPQSKKENKPKSTHNSKIELMDLKEFFLFMKKHHKSDNQIKNIILERIKNEDKRFIYNQHSKEVLVYKSDFLDLI